MTRFENVSCSQCGGSFGPGDSGYSHCSQHTASSDLVAKRMKEIKRVNKQITLALKGGRPGLVELCQKRDALSKNLFQPEAV